MFVCNLFSFSVYVCMCMYVKMNFDVQKARCGVFGPETTPYYHAACYAEWFQIFIRSRWVCSQ
jgi:hypothetical protein